MTGSLPAKLALLSVLPLFQTDAKVLETDAKVLEKVLAKDDAAFVKELSRAGYGDLAEDVTRAMEAAGRGGGDLVRLDLAADRAAREMDPVKRLELLEAGIKEREDFIAAHPGTPEAAEIQASQLEQYRTVGELITSVVEEGTSPDVESLRERGLEIFDKAVKELRTQQDKLAEPPAAPLTEEQQADHDLQRMFNLYGLVRTQYFRAVLYEKGSFERQLMVEGALKVMLDLQLDFPDQFVCYEGYIYEGLCHKSVDAFSSAIESFDAAIAIREAYPEEKGVYTLDPGAADIVSSAVLQKMLLLSEQGDQAGAVAVAEDFAARTPDPWKTLKGLSILSEQATAYRALGNEEAVASTAKTLIASDPNGPGGKRGRELLGEGSAVTLGAVGLLRLAESSLQTEPDHAMELCQQAMALARGTPDVANTSARAGLLLGALYAQRGSPHEAAVVWDTTAARFPKGKDAPECLWRAIKGYLNLQGQERRAIYKDVAQARLADLTRLYPDHPYSAQAFIIEGQQAEAEQDFKRAADIYQKLAPGAAGYEEGLYRAGNAWSRMARDHFAASRVTEGKEAAKRAEDLLKKAREELAAAAKKTLETSEQQRFADLAFSARTSLGELYLMPGVERAAEVMPLFQGAESELADDAARMSTVWELRFRALSQEKKLDEAMALFDARVKENPSARWLTAGAGVLAPILDSRGMELRKADPTSKEADRLWQKAAANYQLAIKGQLEGRESVQMETLESVADRLFLFALHFEGLPETTDSFVDYGGKPLSNELLDTAVRAYELLVPLTPSYRTAIKLARTEAFLGRWEEAAATYADLFQRENFADPVTKTINQEAVAAKPELIFAYIEWGVAEREIGVEQGNDTTRLQRASGIFEALVMGTQQESKLWWQSKFYQVQTMVDRGAYDVADVALKSLQRNWEHYDANQYGLEERFKKLQEEVGKKVFGTNKVEKVEKKMMGRMQTGVGAQRVGRAVAAALFSLCWLVVGSAGLSAQQDHILLKTGKDKEVRIKSEDFDGVRSTTATSSSPTLTRWNEIDSIEYGGARGFQEAMATVGAGRWTEALNQLEALAADKELRPVLRQNVLYQQGVANLRLGKPDEAVAAYGLLLQEFPQSRYLLPVGASLLSIHLAKDDVPGATRALEPVLAAGKSGADEALVAALGVLRGRLAEEQKQFDQAEKDYTAASRATKAEPDVISAAKLGLARCAQKRGNAAAAETAYRELTLADATNAQLAGAWNGLGDIAFEQASAKRDADGLRVALLSYLRGVVLYVPAQGEVTDEYERALAGAARAFKAIGELEGNAERKRLFLDRSKQRRDQLAAQFPGSRFLKGL